MGPRLDVAHVKRPAVRRSRDRLAAGFGLPSFP
jgi:hypothetical protein